MSKTKVRLKEWLCGLDGIKKGSIGYIDGYMSHSNHVFAVVIIERNIKLILFEDLIIVK